MQLVFNRTLVMISSQSGAWTRLRLARVHELMERFIMHKPVKANYSSQVNGEVHRAQASESELLIPS